MANRFFIKKMGLINASGNDLIDFLNRMSTNDFRKLPREEFRKTVLTTDKGRIVDLVNVLNFTDQPYIITSNNFQDKVISHLSKYIITDDVILEKRNEKFFSIIITGDNLDDAVKILTDTVLIKDRVYKTGPDEFLFKDDFKFKSINIVCKEDSLQKFKDILKGLHEQSCEKYEFMRIEAGLPEGENEFNDNINPMECGLDKYISFVKGCYIGQEVIARLDSQGKRPKQMVKIESDKKLSKDEKIFTGESDAGFITSIVSDSEKSIALGFIRSVNLDFDKEYFVKNGEVSNKISISKLI